MSKLKFVKNTVYNLKNRMGFPIAYHVIDEHDVDPDTGNKTTVIKVINIKKAIILRAREFRSFIYDLAFISSNKDFTTGGFFDPEDRRVILSAKDLKGHKPQIWDYFIFENARYDVIEKLEFENNYAYALLARKIRGQEITQILTRHNGIVFEQELDHYILDKLVRDVVQPLNLTQDLVENP